MDANSSSSSADGQDIEEERRDIREILSKMQSPKVRTESCFLCWGVGSLWGWGGGGDL